MVGIWWTLGSTTLMTQGRGSQEEKVGQPTIKEGSHTSLRRTAAYLHHFILFLCAGIALSLDQWEKLKTAIPEIDAKIHGD